MDEVAGILVLMPVVLMERFLVFRGLLFGDSVLCPNVDDSGVLFGESILVSLAGDVLMAVKFASGSDEAGDSGDELGDGSVKVESTVEIVVVGEDSVDSVRTVAVEPRLCSPESGEAC